MDFEKMVFKHVSQPFQVSCVLWLPKNKKKTVTGVLSVLHGSKTRDKGHLHMDGTQYVLTTALTEALFDVYRMEIKGIKYNVNRILKDSLSTVTFYMSEYGDVEDNGDHNKNSNHPKRYPWM